MPDPSVDNRYTGGVQKVESGTATSGSWVAAVVGVAPGTGTTTSVADTASSTTLLAANAARKGAAIYNDSTSILYVKLGATASATSFLAKLQPEGYLEVPFGYTGIIDGVWSADAAGSARISELT